MNLKESARCDSQEFDDAEHRSSKEPPSKEDVEPATCSICGRIYTEPIGWNTPEMRRDSHQRSCQKSDTALDEDSDSEQEHDSINSEPTHTRDDIPELRVSAKGNLLEQKADGDWFIREINVARDVRIDT